MLKLILISWHYKKRFCSTRLSKDIKYVCEFVAIKALTLKENILEDNTSPSIAVELLEWIKNNVIKLLYNKLLWSRCV